jgi:NADH:ubiquinone oxidoreductase subunit K
VVIKVLFVLLVLCTAALVAVGIAVLLRVRRHFKQEQMDAQARSTLDEAAEKTSRAADEDESS